mmetsp:Transcript_134874/g.234466  ORF Transcript_134874/g.234466 Transcript_134874/m.234466 type:complete len:221 (+) Transcript_134874:106-768(+)
MQSRALFASVLLVLNSNAAALHAVEHGPVTNYANEAADIANMMESVRQKTEGNKYKSHEMPALTAKKAKKDARDMFPDLDTELMNKADSIVEQVREEDLAAKKATEKKTALTSEHQESAHARAARFFALHGMDEVGRLLGDSLSSEEAEKAKREAAEAKEKLEEASVSSISIPNHGVPKANMPSMSLDAGFADIMAEDNEENKKRWQAVDALKRRRPIIA